MGVFLQILLNFKQRLFYRTRPVDCFVNISQIPFFLHTYNVVIKGGWKLYFTHYSCVVFIFFNTVLSKSAFSAYYFGKLVFRLFMCFLVLEFVIFKELSYLIIWLLFI